LIDQDTNESFLNRHGWRNGDISTDSESDNIPLHTSRSLPAALRNSQQPYVQAALRNSQQPYVQAALRNSQQPYVQDAVTDSEHSDDYEYDMDSDIVELNEAEDDLEVCVYIILRRHKLTVK